MSFAVYVQLLCQLHEGSVTSWIRSRKRNQEVGGAQESKHLSGQAVDVVLDDMTNRAAFIAQARKLGFFVLDEQDHIHVGVKR